jgi:pimeloyl-ACP methyl ester carboxylesterase
VRRWSTPRSSGTTVVLVHGFGAGKDSASVARVAVGLAVDGHHVLSYTARGHGSSGGLCTLGDLEHLDVAAATRLARIDADRVVLVGASMGAIAVLRHAADEAPTGIVTVSSPSGWTLPRSAQGIGAAALTQTAPGRWLARRALGVRLAPGWTAPPPPADLAARIEVPHAIVHGRNDVFLRSDEAERLHRAAREPRRIEVVDGMGHAYVAAAVPAVRANVRWVLEHAARSPGATALPAG